MWQTGSEHGASDIISFEYLAVQKSTITGRSHSFRVEKVLAYDSRGSHGRHESSNPALSLA